ncbi:MAG: hypothetical protein KIT27_10820 [Legionellales bacterium]|nr:hypothetical protein [Legionellales bacterium]
MKLVKSVADWMNGFAHGIFYAYSEIKHIREQQPLLRYSAIEYSKKTQSFVCLIQVVGKNVFYRIPPQTILENEEFLYSFSQADIKIITIANEKIKSFKKYEVIEFEQDSDEHYLIVKNSQTAKLKKIIMNEFNDAEITKNFSPADAFRIGYNKSLIDTKKFRHELSTIKKNLKISKNYSRANQINLIKNISKENEYSNQ